jgi:hypothetical protein
MIQDESRIKDPYKEEHRVIKFFGFKNVKYEHPVIGAFLHPYKRNEHRVDYKFLLYNVHRGKFLCSKEDHGSMLAFRCILGNNQRIGIEKIQALNNLPISYKLNWLYYTW